MSLMPRSRLIKDSLRSPTVAVTTMAKPKTTPCHHAACRVNGNNRPAHNAHASVDPANPSHDFFGETLGAIGCLPRNTPTAYPPVSLHTTVATNTVTRRGPSAGTTINT